MDILQTTNTIVVGIGIPTLIGCSIYIGKKLQILDNLETTTNTIKHNMKIVGNFLTKNFTTFNPSELHDYSPLNLTGNGNEFIATIGFDKIFAQNKNDFFTYIDTENPKLKYDVEMAAMKSIWLLADESYMEFLKIYFYNNPKRTMANTAPTLGVYVRDAYLAAHPEITE